MELERKLLTELERIARVHRGLGDERRVTSRARSKLHYDIPDAFGDMGTNVVLELKCERKIPVWIVELIRHFDLTRGSFSKYHSSMEHQYTSLFELEALDRIPGETFHPLLAL